MFAVKKVHHPSDDQRQRQSCSGGCGEREGPDGLPEGARSPPLVSTCCGWRFASLRCPWRSSRAARLCPARLPSPPLPAPTPRSSACNARARSCGVRPGMPVAAASALDRRAAHPDAGPGGGARSAGAHRRVRDSVQLHGQHRGGRGSAARDRRIAQDFRRAASACGHASSRSWSDQGYACSLACAPTPLAAQFFARAGLPVRIQHDDALRAEHRAACRGRSRPAPGSGHPAARYRGLHHRRLPQAAARGLARRAGRELHRRARPRTGPRSRSAPGLRSSRALYGRAAVAGAGRRRAGAAVCRPAAARRVDAGFWPPPARARSACASSSPTRIGATTSLRARSCRRPRAISITWRPCCASAWSGLPCRRPPPRSGWKACCLLPLAARNLALLPDAREQAETIARLIERLRARLGANAVQGLDTVGGSPPGIRLAHGRTGRLEPGLVAAALAPALGPRCAAPARRDRRHPAARRAARAARRSRAHRVGLVGRRRHRPRVFRRAQSRPVAALDLPRAPRERRVVSARLLRLNCWNSATDVTVDTEDKTLGAATKTNAPPGWVGRLFLWVPDDVLLSHGIHRTIIGAEAFHGPVRNGKGWDHLAMFVRRSL